MSNHIVIVGAGEVGYHLAGVLSREGHAVSVIDPDPLKARKLQEAHDVQALVGDGTRADVLAQAGTSRADLVVVVSDHDRVNMLTCLIAKRMGAKRTILRLKDTRMLHGYRYFYKQTLGFDVALSTDELAAEEILRTVREHHALEVETFADGRVQLRRLRLREECELTSEPISRLRLPTGVLVVAVRRGKEFFLPDGTTQLAVSDHIYVLGRAEDLDAFERMAGERTLLQRRIVLMGGGGVGREVLRRLKGTPGLSILVIEEDGERARRLAADTGPQVLVLEGDAADHELLLEEQVGEANVFVATSDNDERNIVACQLAKSMEVERTVALISKASYQAVYDLFPGVDQAVSPRSLCSNTILRFVRLGSVYSIAVISDGRAEVLELEVRFDEGSEAEVKVKNLGLPEGCVLGSVVRGEEVIIPRGDTTVHHGDHVIVFTLPEVVGKVERVFRGRGLGG